MFVSEVLFSVSARARAARMPRKKSSLSVSVQAK